MAALTDWESNQIQPIDTLLRNCEIRNAEFNIKHHLLNKPNVHVQTADEWARFRSFTIDLYSVLDYICYLLFCHFQNGGQPDFSSRSRNVKFPYTERLRKSEFPGQENGAKQNRERWRQEQMQIIFGYGPFQEQEYRLYDYVSNSLLEVQHIKDVDAAGNIIGGNPEEGSVVESFNLLHFYRNYSAHRDFIRFSPNVAVLYSNRNVNSPRFGEEVFQPQNQAPPWGNGNPAGWQSIQIARGFWVKVPDFQNFPNLKPLLIKASQLCRFVKDFRKNALRFLGAGPYNHDVRYGHLMA